jgi:hypothetical protein
MMVNKGSAINERGNSITRCETANPFSDPIFGMCSVIQDRPIPFHRYIQYDVCCYTVE